MDTKDFVKKSILALKPTWEEPADDASIGDKLDSLDIMELIAKIEGEFGIEIAAEDIVPENFESVSAIASMIDAASGK